MKPSVFIAMPCYDSVKINTMISVVKLIQQLGKSGIQVGINTMKSPLIHQARNYLTSIFLTTEYQYMLFIDSDVGFEPEAVVRMMVAKKNIVCTPYRVKEEDPSTNVYTVQFKDPKIIPILPGGLVEIIKNHPDLKIKNKATPNAGKSHEFYYNFFDFSFNDGYAMGEDVSFCRLARDNGFKIYANIESPTSHQGEYAWVGKFGDSLEKKPT